MKLLCTLLVLCLALSQTADSDGILELDSKTFHKTIKSKGNLLLFFHSPWEGRSKAFEYEFRRLARLVQEEELDVKLAKINLPANREIAEIYHLRSYPALYFYQNGNDEVYNGDLKVDKILFYLKKKTLDPFTRVYDDMEVASHLKRGIAVAVAHFSNDQSLKYKHFVNAIRDNENTDILIAIGDAKVSQPADSFTVFNTESTPTTFDGRWSVEEIRRFVALASLPPIVPYTSVWTRSIFNNDHHVREHLVYMSEDQELFYNTALRRTLETVAKKGFGQFLVLDLNAYERNMIDYFGFDRDQLPILFYVDLREKSGSIKYVYHNEEYTVEEILDFVKKARDGELYPFYKSEPIYKELDGFVRRLVSKDFMDVAYDPYTNVLVEFVVPECRLCKRIEDDYQHLAHDYLNADDVVIARVDSSKNEIKGIVPPDFPTVYLYQAGGDGEHYVHIKNDLLTYSQLKEFVERNKVVVNKPKKIEAVKQKQDIADEERDEEDSADIQKQETKQDMTTEKRTQSEVPKEESQQVNPQTEETMQEKKPRIEDPKEAEQEKQEQEEKHEESKEKQPEEDLKESDPKEVHSTMTSEHPEQHETQSKDEKVTKRVEEDLKEQSGMGEESKGESQTKSTTLEEEEL